MWETISDLNVLVQVAKASIFFRRYTLLKILPKIGTGLILLAPSVYIYIYINLVSLVIKTFGKVLNGKPEHI